MRTSERLLKCPFCGEDPQLLRDGRTVAHACMVLDRELRAMRQAWNTRWYDSPCTPEDRAKCVPARPGDDLSGPCDDGEVRRQKSVFRTAHGADKK